MAINMDTGQETADRCMIASISKAPSERRVHSWLWRPGKVCRLARAERLSGNSSP
jgi:hypothetical protein